jgi:2-oxoisovalerate dehydrogenase E2 component (dihydrolipoyl transacylase)
VAKVTMPQLGESVAEGTIGRWLKQPGDSVAKYEPLLEVITDKVNAEVPSPFAGVLREILAPEGAVVPNNAEIAIIETADDASAAGSTAEAGSTAASEAPKESSPSADVPPTAAPDAPKEPTTPSAQPAGTPAPAAAAPRTMVVSTPPAATAEVDEAADPNARMTPAVRRLLREHGLEASQLVGTGGGGRITREDVLARVEAIRTGAASPAAPTSAASNGHVPDPAPASASASASPAPAPASAPASASASATPASGSAAAAPASATAASASTPSSQTGPRAGIAFPPGTDEVLVPMSQMRKGIAAQMTRALQAPHAYLQMEVDLTRLVALREREKRAYQAKEGIGLSYVPFVVKASAEALKRNPTFNAHWTDQGLLAKRRINIGVAVAVDEGLIVPVVRDADQLSIHGLNLAIADVANRARANKLRLDDFGGGTFTVDNTGYLGTTLVMPILNVPEVGIVTMEAITKRPVVVSTPDGDVIAIRPVMNMVLGIDHRANDGAGGAAMLRDIKAWLEGVGPETAIY